MNFHLILPFAFLALVLSLQPTDTHADLQRTVKFQSRYDEMLNIFWIGDTGGANAPVLIVEVEPHGLVDVKTFTGHEFYASRVSDNVRALPRKVTVVYDEDIYEFVPESCSAVPSSDADTDVDAARKIASSSMVMDIDGNAIAKVDTNSAKDKGAVVLKGRDPSVNGGLHPGVALLHSGTTAMSVKFKNLSPGCDYYYDDGRHGVYQGRLELGGEATTNTYEGHVFFFTKVGDKSVLIARFSMYKDQVTYVITDPTSLPPRHMQEQADREREFTKLYFQQKGLHWRHFYGPQGARPPPVLHMWGAEEVGQVHRVTSKEGHWRNDCQAPLVAPRPAEEATILNSIGDAITTFFRGPSLQALPAPPVPDRAKKNHVCQSRSPVNLELEVISLAPRAFIIENFLSDYEADQIIAKSKSKLRDSTVGNGDAGGARSDNTRTSKNAWLGRETNEITESLFMRAADVLNLDESILYNTKNAEDMQVVHYVNGQKYDSHHDWGVSGYPESRFITLLLYLTEQPDTQAGGETSFPKAADGGGIKVHPGKGNAVLFYNLLEDGNGDDLALHAALPVRGDHEKWLANYWVWDSHRR